MGKIQPLKPEDVKYLIVHHTATSRDFTTFNSVKNYHINTLKYDDIFYHYFITGDGTKYDGRPINKTVPFSENTLIWPYSLHICLTGNFETEKPSEAQLTTLKSILLSLKNQYKIPLDKILGHKEASVTGTLCPGKNLMNWLDNFRKSNSNSTITLSEVADELDKIHSEITKLLLKIRGY